MYVYLPENISIDSETDISIVSQVGYHNEHHDFPSVPWTRLPALRALAPEFYDNIPSHPSWPMVTINFIRDKEVGIFARAKRLSKEQKNLSSGGKKGQEEHLEYDKSD